MNKMAFIKGLKDALKGYIKHGRPPISVTSANAGFDPNHMKDLLHQTVNWGEDIQQRMKRINKLSEVNRQLDKQLEELLKK